MRESASRPEELLEELLNLVRTGDNGPMYEGWGEDQEKLRRMQLDGGDLYPEPYTRSAHVSDRENEELLGAILRLFGELDRREPADGVEAVREQQRSGANVADVTTNYPGKFRSRFQEQFSGVGFASLVDRLIRAEVERRAASMALAMVKKYLSAHKAEAADHAHDRGMAADGGKEHGLCGVCGKSLADGHRHDAHHNVNLPNVGMEAASHEKGDKGGEDSAERREREHLIEAVKADMDEMKNQLSAALSEVAALRSQLSAMQAPVGSRTWMTQPVPGGANQPGVLQPTLSAEQQALDQKIAAFSLQGRQLIERMSQEPDRAAKVREQLINATLAFKNGVPASITDPDLLQIAQSLSLPATLPGSFGVPHAEGGAQ